MSKNKSGKTYSEILPVTQMSIWLNKIMRVLIHAILILPALIFVPMEIQPFELPKKTIFLVLMCALIFFYTVYKFEIKQRQIYAPPKPLLLILGGWLLVKIAGLFASPNKDLSLWGSYIRQEGLVVFVFLLIFFFIIIALIKEKPAMQRLMASAAAVGSLVGFYGVMQKHGFDFQFLVWQSGASQRIASTLGNPLFLAPFLLFTLGFTLYLIKHSKSYRLFLTGGAIVQLLAIYYTANASSALALAGAVVLALIVYWWRQKRRAAYTVMGLTAVSAILLGLISFNVIGTGWTDKTFNGFSIYETSNLQRLYVWETGWQAFKDKPWLGWGNELFSEAFYSHQNSNLLPPLESNFDRAHNIFIDHLVMEGVFSCLALLALLIYSIIYGVRRYYRTDKIEYLLAACMIAGFAINYSFSITTIAPKILLFFTLALLFYQGDKRAAPVNAVKQYQDNYYFGYFVLFLVMTLSCLYMVRPWQADMIYGRSLAIKNTDEKMKIMNLAVGKWSYKEYLGELIKLNKAYVQHYRQQDPERVRKYIDNGDQLTAQMLRRYPNQYMSYVLAADFNAAIPDQAKVNEYFQRATEIAPKRFEIYWIWGNDLLELQQPELAVEKYLAAIQIDPSQPYPYKALAELYGKISEPEKAQAALREYEARLGD